MQHKYRKLIEEIKSGDPRTRILKETSHMLIIGVSTGLGSILFVITQTFGRVNIQWKVEGGVLKKHQLSWDFDEFEDQDKMIEKIAYDIEQYQKNVETSTGYIK